jgi:hypothetical protein
MAQRDADPTPEEFAARWPTVDVDLLSPQEKVDFACLVILVTDAPSTAVLVRAITCNEGAARIWRRGLQAMRKGYGQHAEKWLGPVEVAH